MVKTLPIIISNEDRNISLNEFIGFVDKVWKDSINHIDYPYTKIAEDFQLKPEFFYTYQESGESDQVTVNDKTIAVEELFFNQNITTGIAVAEARGVILCTAIQHVPKVFEFTPMQIKLAITGVGKADKKQVQ